MSERLVAWLVGSFVVITLVITAAVIFIPTVSEAATVIGILLGAYVSLLGGAGVGAAVTRQVRKQSDHDRDQENR